MSSMLWSTSFILRALSPLSLDHDFLHFRLLTDPEDDDLQRCGDDYLLQWLCLSLSRAAKYSSTMQAPFCVAFPNSLTAISVVFPAGRKTEMKLALQQFLTNFSEIRLDCTAEEELNSGLTMQNVLLCGLSAALVCDGWTVLDGNIALQGSVKEWLDGTVTEAVTFDIRTEANDCIDLVLSPDVVRIRPFKIDRLLSGPLKNGFNDGAVVPFDDYMETLLPDDISEMKCLVLPSMQEGVVAGLSRAAPKEFNLRNHKEIWNERHGLVLPSEVFYIQVSFPFEGGTRRSWFPSCLVLRSCGLIAALPSVRAARMQSIIPKFISTISQWDFFGFGKLKIKSILKAVKVEDQQGSQWTTANSVLQASQTRLNDSSSELKVDISSDTILTCFRRAKLPSSHYAVNRNRERFTSDVPVENAVNFPGRLVHSENPSTANSPTSLRIPVFSKRKIGDVGVGCTRLRSDLELSIKNKSTSCMRQGVSSTKEYQQGVLISVPADSRQEFCLSQKRVCAGSESVVDYVSKQTLSKERGPSMLKLQKAPISSGVAPPAKSQQSHGLKESSKDKPTFIAEQDALKPKDKKANKESTSRGKKSTGGEKKSTTAAIDQDANKIKVYSKHAQGKLSDLTVPELKLFLSVNKTKVSGKKEELIQRVVLLLLSSQRT